MTSGRLKDLWSQVRQVVRQPMRHATRGPRMLSHPLEKTTRKKPMVRQTFLQKT
jgi:hypothetical protein